MATFEIALQDRDRRKHAEGRRLRLTSGKSSIAFNHLYGNA
jgi:hypothetical protein